MPGIGADIGGRELLIDFGSRIDLTECEDPMEEIFELNFFGEADLFAKQTIAIGNQRLGRVLVDLQRVVVGCQCGF